MTVTVMTIQEVSRRSGLSEPMLRYYEEVGPVSVAMQKYPHVADARSQIQFSNGVDMRIRCSDFAHS
jgi:hypothetical protein